MVEFVEATFEGPVRLAAAKAAVTRTLGFDHLVDAAAVVANFTMLTRIADATGTPLDRGTQQISGDLRAALGLDSLTSARFEA